MRDDRNKEVKVEVKDSPIDQEVGRMTSIPARVAARHGIKNGEIIHGHRAHIVLKEALEEKMDEYKRK